MAEIEPATGGELAGTRQRMLRASIELLGTEGARALTLRGVEKAASAPHGSARYHFGTYEDLLHAVLEEIVRLDKLALPDTLPVGGAAEALTAVLMRWLGEDRMRLLARYELMLAAARNLRLQARLRHATTEFHAVVEPLLADPSHARIVVGALDGLLFDSLTRGPATTAELRWAVEQILRPAGGAAAPGADSEH
jgi:AcrR family transcriptional regulator